MVMPKTNTPITAEKITIGQICSWMILERPSACKAKTKPAITAVSTNILTSCCVRIFMNAIR